MSKKIRPYGQPVLQPSQHFKSAEVDCPCEARFCPRFPTYLIYQWNLTDTLAYAEQMRAELGGGAFYANFFQCKKRCAQVHSSRFHPLGLAFDVLRVEQPRGGYHSPYVIAHVAKAMGANGVVIRWTDESRGSWTHVHIDRGDRTRPYYRGFAQYAN